MRNTNLTKSRKRVRDHGEVFTPDFIIENMLDLVNNETQRIESRFLEPACGDGNFLIKILERKLDVVKKTYKRNQFDYEKYSFIAVSSLYGVELLEDNAVKARERLYTYVYEQYSKLYKKKTRDEFQKSIKYLLNKNIVQGDALTLKDSDGDSIVFSEWSIVRGGKVKRRDFQYKDLTSLDEKSQSLFTIPETSDRGEAVFLASPVKEYKLTNFMDIYKAYE